MNEIRIRIQCAEDQDHAKILKLRADIGAAYARDIGELVCGTSQMYIFPPGDRSPIFRCVICGGKLSYTLEQLAATETWEFDGYRLRATLASDLELAREWTEADRAHAGLDPAFWLEQGPTKQSYLLHDEDGPVFFFKGVLAGRTLEVFIQFPAPAAAITEMLLSKALAAGTRWLAERMRGVVDEFTFETKSPSLKRFCERRLNFEERDGKMRKRIGELAAKS
jgi:hypothetical protein